MPFFVLLPTIGWTWPALVPLLTAVAAAKGYQTLTDDKGMLRGRLTARMENIRRETISLDSVLTEVISEDIGNEERISFELDDLLLVFRKDSRGKFFVDVSGPNTYSALTLKLRGEEFSRELIKKFAYHKMVEQIERRGATIIQETEEEDETTRLRARQWR